MYILIALVALVLIAALLIGLRRPPRPMRHWHTTQLDDDARRALVERGGLQ